jgi:LPPG:FO 2-phospho-L-lactate transferase
MSRIVALCGGIGGAKLALGLDRIVAPDVLTVIVNTGDDFDHFGLRISPDVDTVLYTLGGLADRERGWGRSGETWNFMSAIRQLGREDWFLLGDQDLALHVARSHHLARGLSLSAFVADTARAFGIAASVLPMTDDDVRTVVETDLGTLPFQRYFVEHRCEPVVRALHFDGAAGAKPAPGVLDAIADSDVDLIVLCPSNPYLSIDPILAVPGIRQALARTSAPVVAVSPIIGGHAVKGPTVKIMAELGIAATNRSIASHYADIIDALVIDRVDADEALALGIPVRATDTLMRGIEDRLRLATEVAAFGRSLRTDAAVAVGRTS